MVMWGGGLVRQESRRANLSRKIRNTYSLVCYDTRIIQDRRGRPDRAGAVSAPADDPLAGAVM